MSMELTPVRIRGRHSNDRKRFLRHTSSLLHSQNSQNLPFEKQSQDQQKKRRKLKGKMVKSALSRLESLPQELLEIIFSYSLNICLPRASLALEHKLSSQHTEMEFTMRSIFHTGDHRATLRNRKPTSDPRLHSEILTCRFFTYKFFLLYVQRAHDAMIKLRGKAWEKTGVAIPDQTYFDTLFAYKFTKVNYLSFANGFHIPEKLLHGPFTKDKASLLYVLVAFNGEIDWTGSTAGETAKEGMIEAIKEENEYAVASLAVLLGVRKAITTEMIKYAVVDCGCNINILRHLLFNAQILGHDRSKYLLDFHDPTLWAWAADHPERGDVLTAMLKKAKRFDLEFYFEDDANCMSIVGFPYAGSRFDSRRALGRIDKALLTNLYLNYGRKLTRDRHGESELSRF